MVTVDRNGDLYLNTGDAPELIDGQTLVERVGILVGRNPDIQVLVGGDQAVGTLADGRLADVAPTMLAVAGLEQPVEMTGRSLLRQSDEAGAK